MKGIQHCFKCFKLCYILGKLTFRIYNKLLGSITLLKDFQVFGGRHAIFLVKTA